MKKFHLLLLSLPLVLSACSSNEGPNPSDESAPVTTPRHDITLSRAEQETLNGETAFAFDLFGKIAEEKSGDNLIIAPYNVATALSMVANGADGEVHDALVRALGTTSLENLNAVNKKLMDELMTLDPTVTMRVANSIWATPDFSYAPEFSRRLLESYKAESLNADLSTNDGVDAFNAWCSQATDGMISKMLDGPSDETFMIASANLFKGRWENPFKKEDTKKEVFHGSKGDRSVDMMSRSEGFSAVASDNCTAARMYYGNNAFRMTVILPAAETTMAEFLPTFNAEKWDMISNTLLSESSRKIYLPKFSLDHSGNLRQQLAAMIPEAFGPGAKFSRIAEGALVTLEKVNHKAVIEVDESGTKAAAVTAIPGATSPVGSSYDEDFRADRPFIFVIDETSTGAILFMGVVNNL